MLACVMGLLIAAVPTAARAQTAGAFLQMGFGARGMALGNALAADTAAGTFYNPALAPFVRRQHLDAGVALLTFDRTLQFLQFAAPLKPSAGIAAGLVHAGVQGIDGRDNSGYHTRTLSTDEYAFFLAFGTHLTRRVTIGAAFKFYYADYLRTVEPVESIGLDIGVAARLTERLDVGLAVSDLLARYEWNTADAYPGRGGARTVDRLPTRVRLGTAYSLLDGRARLFAEGELRLTPRERPGGASETVRRTFLRVGGSYRLVDAFTVRAGLDRLGGGDGLRPSAGFGIGQAIGQLRLRAAYAFVWETALHDPLHAVSFRLYL